MTLPAVIEDARTSGARVLVLSPHLDDAVLSCGALLGSLGGCEITVLTLFTACTAGPHTRAARSFLRQCSHPDAATLFTARRDEDRDVVERLGARPEHAGHADALFRRRDVPEAVGRVLPELAHRYPTYRFDIARGRISGGDRALRAGLARDLAERAGEVDLLLAPLGVGRHVDHLITRDLGAEWTRTPVVHYADFPYSLTHEPDPTFVRRAGLRPHVVDDGLDAKEQLIRGYRTQVDALFPDGVVPRAPETYWAA
ncbi:PIG-L deacetylase family protein [Actinomycetospora termitidis]|uniref:PIG-L family deacetylase n=1 Tax=Actinomycetospora termitidis TaxID=3053470 RepID=A0ABT7M5G7_9PSEU|nr:PIG-L family deacetylase [Actinomycetospora sp. Odt1-22]MDL5155696.1 PIG-L family deacetylase [Actinomycetospora sp. Odt1-22]